MNWLNKLERKFGKYAIPNLIVWLIGAYTIGFLSCFTWADMAFSYMDTYAYRDKSYFSANYGDVLLSAWYDVRENLGYFPF